MLIWKLVQKKTFLTNKIKNFKIEYKDEIINFEIELSSIYEHLSNMITENSDIMNKNELVKDEVLDLQAQDLENKYNNIKSLIDMNIKLLKDN